MSTADSILRRLYRGLEALYQIDTGLDPHSVVVRRPASPGPRETLLLRQADDALEVALVFDEQMLSRVEATADDRVLADEHLGDALSVVEGLSHLVYVAEAARQNRPVSGLELETQAEVDKLAMCLLHRWPHAQSAFEGLVDRLYHRFELHPMSPDLCDRYRTANRLALGFSRQLRDPVDRGHLPSLRRALRQFWGASMPNKRALASGAA